MNWKVEIYPSGSIVITDGAVALYVHSVAELVKAGAPMTDTERVKLATDVCAKLNRYNLPQLLDIGGVV